MECPCTCTYTVTLLTGEAETLPSYAAARRWLREQQPDSIPGDGLARVTRNVDDCACRCLNCSRTYDDAIGADLQPTREQAAA